MKDRIAQARAIYLRLRAECNKLPDKERWKYRFNQRLVTSLQTTLYVSERKAKEYIKLIKLTEQFDPSPSKT